MTSVPTSPNNGGSPIAVTTDVHIPTPMTNKASVSLTNEASVSLTNKGSASQTVDGGGMLTLKGGLVKIN